MGGDASSEDDDALSVGGDTSSEDDDASSVVGDASSEDDDAVSAGGDASSEDDDVFSVTDGQKSEVNQGKSVIVVERVFAPSLDVVMETLPGCPAENARCQVPSVASALGDGEEPSPHSAVQVD